MRAYSEAYLDHVVEQQGKLFDLVSQVYPTRNLLDFINTYMTSKTRKAIDKSQAYVSTMDARDLLEYFADKEEYQMRECPADVIVEGFFPMWLGEFYAYYQWYYNISSAEVVQRLPVATMQRMYYGLRDLTLELAVQKVGLV